MLHWTVVEDRWRGNGFEIRRLAPKRWELGEVLDDGGVIVSDPIAEFSSLAACRHKAEKLHEISEMQRLRGRLAAVAVTALVLAILATGPIFIPLAVIGSAAAVELTLTWFDGRVGGARHIAQ